MDRELRFAIIGAGMAGILAAIKLERGGLDRLHVYEKADRVGGTWRENTYPGIACDVPSHLYSYSFALNPGWTHTYSPGAEIQAYFERVAAEHDVVAPRPLRRRGGRVPVRRTAAGTSTTASGHQDEVDVVIAATGVLHHPRYPDIEGLDTFGGAAFHSARWDHGVAHRRAPGSASSAPGRRRCRSSARSSTRADSVSLFQRTAQWIMPSHNPRLRRGAAPRVRPTTRRRCASSARRASRSIFDVFSDGVVDADSPAMHLDRAGLPGQPRGQRAPTRSCASASGRATAPRASASSSPPDFYDAIQRPNAELVTDPHRAHRGARACGPPTAALHELDVLVLATGFKVDAFMRPMHVIGRDGQHARPRRGTHGRRPTCRSPIPEFPNFFMLNGPNGPVGNFSLIEVAELQIGYILQLVDRATRRRVPGGQPDATRRSAAFEAERARGGPAHHLGRPGCRSWYLDDRGVPMVWPWPFRASARRWPSPIWPLRPALSLAGHMPKAAERNRSTASGGPRSSTWACPERPER